MNYQRIVILLAFAFIVFSCQKDEKTVPEGILKNYLSTISSSYNNYFYPLNEAEVGYKFKPLVNGNIVSLGLRMYSAGEYTVNIYTGSWNATINKIAFAKIEQPILQMWNYVQIPAFKITPDMTYYITVRMPANSRFERTQNVTFPVNTSNISILSRVCIFYGTTTSYYDNDDGAGSPTPYIESFPDFVFSN